MKKNPVTVNLRVLEPSRSPPKPGDVFVMLPPDGKYLFGRVISIDADAGWGPSVLIYIYRVRSDTKTPSQSALDSGNLLVPPMITNRLPWSRGYFENVGYTPLGAGGRLQQHCFRNSSGQYLDEYNAPLAGPTEPVGQRALHSYRTIDDEISKALGIPLAPD